MKNFRFVRGLITTVAAAAGKVLRFAGTGRPGESFTAREIFQHYGLASRPLAGAEFIALIQGNQVIVLGEADRRYSIALEDGEVALHSHEGVKVHLKNGKTVEISGADKVNMPDAAEINLGGARATLQQLIDGRFKQLFDVHTHSGVASGGQVSGAPVIPLDLASCATDITRAK